MFLKDFAEIRGVKADTVATYIRRHPEIAALTSTEGYHMVLSEEAIDILDKKYPMPKPVQVIQDTESLKKLNEAQQTIILMQQKMLEMRSEKEQLALKAERVLMLEADIEHRDELLDKAEEQLAEEKAAHQTTAAELADIKHQLDAAQQELKEFQNLPWYKKAFWKKK